VVVVMVVEVVVHDGGHGRVAKMREDHVAHQLLMRLLEIAKVRVVVQVAHLVVEEAQRVGGL